jgi:predicted ATPase
VLGLWRSSDPEKAGELDQFLNRCLPEIARALVKPSPQGARQRLWIQQADGQQFDAAHVSDGLLAFTALAMLAFDTPEGSVIFVEEPEQSIHPRRLTQLVDLLRLMAEKRDSQFVIATHSPTLLNEFRDEPESIILFSRGSQGARMKALSEFPELVKSLRENQPGDLLAEGFFNEGL